MGHKLPSKKPLKNKKSAQHSKNSSKTHSKNTSFHKVKNSIDADIKNLEVDLGQKNRSANHGKGLMTKRRDQSKAMKKVQNLTKKPSEAKIKPL